MIDIEEKTEERLDKEIKNIIDFIKPYLINDFLDECRPYEIRGYKGICPAILELLLNLYVMKEAIRYSKLWRNPMNSKGMDYCCEPDIGNMILYPIRDPFNIHRENGIGVLVKIKEDYLYIYGRHENDGNSIYKFNRKDFSWTTT